MSEKMTFNVTGTTDKMKADLRSKQHEIIIDEPPEMGGSNKGPDPIANLLASLAGCENVIANMVAQEIEFDLQSIEFDINGELDPRGLMGDGSVQPYFEKVQVYAKVATSESQDRIDELKEKVDARCPVYTMLKAAGVELEANWTKI